MDEELIALQDIKELSLKFYDWNKKSITFGHFIKSEEYLIENEMERLEIDYARRPTGGGILFHIDDLSFSLLIPKTSPLFRENTIESYRVINTLVGKALKNVFKGEVTFFNEDKQGSSFCMAKPTIYDILLFNKKIGGAAQRRVKQGVLHQGSLQLKMPDDSLLRAVLKNPEPLIKDMKENSFSTLGDIEQLKREIKRDLSTLFL